MFTVDKNTTPRCSNKKPDFLENIGLAQLSKM